MMISIHTLRMEGDALPGHFDDGAAISIHTLRMEGDCIALVVSPAVEHFNPHPPHGG